MAFELQYKHLLMSVMVAMVTLMVIDKCLSANHEAIAVFDLTNDESDDIQPVMHSTSSMHSNSNHHTDTNTHSIQSTDSQQASPPMRPPPNTEPRVLVALLVWNGDVSAETEAALWTMSTHPNVGGTLKVVMSSLHRARNHGVQYYIESPHQEDFTHILFVHQDVVFTIADFEHLLASKKPVIAGVSVRRQPPFYPNFIPLGVDPTSKSVLQQTSGWIDIVKQLKTLDTPVEVHATSYEFALIEANVFRQTKVRFGNKIEWFWLESEKHGAYMHLEDEDLTFSKLLRQHNIPIHIHPKVQIAQEIVSHASLDLFLEHNSPNPNPTEYTKSHYLDGEAVVIENKLKGLKDGRNYRVQARQASASVVIATAMWRGIKADTHSQLWNLAQDPNIIGRVGIYQQTLVNARNKLVALVEKEFGSEWSHILFIDADMTFKVDDMHKLLRANEGLIFGLAVKRLLNDHPPAYMPLSGRNGDYNALLESLSSNPIYPIEVKGGGMAFTLVKRQVFDAIKRTAVSGESEWYWCDHYVDEDSGQSFHLSEDYTFCRMARQAGFGVWMHPGAQVGHIDEVNLSIADWLRGKGLKFDMDGRSE